MTPEEQSVTAPNNPTNAASKNSLLKEAMIPLSIVLAGIFVGAGLYFSGGAGGAGGAIAVAPDNEPVAQADNTDQVKPISADDDYYKGNLDAPIQIVEFSDYDCPFCSRFHDTMNDIVDKYPDEVVWTYRHFPIEQLHPQAPAVAVAAECLGELGGNKAFWSFSDAYLAARGTQDATAHDVLIPRLALETGVSQADFTACFEGGEMQARVQADMDNAQETGGRGTPWSILIGPTGKTYPINGALPQAAVEQLIELAKAEA